MKTAILDDPCGSTASTSEYSLLSTESPDGETMGDNIINQERIIRDFEGKLTEAEKHILNQNEKIQLYEATIKDKNSLIDLMNQNKDLMVKQFQDQITELQNALDLSKIRTSSEDDANSAESAELDRKTTEYADFQTLQKEFDKSQSQIALLTNNISQLKAEIVELKSKNINMANNQAKTEMGDDLERIKSTDTSFVLLNHTKVPNIKEIKVGTENKLAITETIPSIGPGWIVILRRFDGSVDFKRHLASGFGELSGEFWIGLETLDKLTSSRRHELYIELVDFDDVTAYARYDNFVVGSGFDDYPLQSLGAYSGNAGDALRSHKGGNMKNCSGFYNWWSPKNYQCNLTGPYTKSRKACESNEGMYWGKWYLDQKYPLKACKMLIRPHC